MYSEIIKRRRTFQYYAMRIFPFANEKMSDTYVLYPLTAGNEEEGI
jgi:hypothetical protein